MPENLDESPSHFNSVFAFGVFYLWKHFVNFRIKEKLLKVQVETGESYPVRTLAELFEKVSANWGYRF